MYDNQRFISIRNYLKKQQGEFADFFGVNQQYISDIERGRKKIPYEILEKIVKLGINLNWLITGDGEMLKNEHSNISINSKTVTGVMTNNGTVHFNSVQEAEKEIEILKQKVDFLEKAIKDKEEIIYLLKNNLK